MKQQSITILLIVFMSLFVAEASAHDIAIANADGVTIYYNWYNKTSLAVTQGSYSGNVVIPESVEYNGSTYSVTIIGSNAFSGCSSLTSVTIGNSVTSIGIGAFRDCSGLTSVIIPNSVILISNYAFQNCSGLTSVTIGNCVTSIGQGAFQNCIGLTSITISNSVTSIGEQAFENCKGLASVHISDIAAWCNIIFNANPLIYAHHLYLNGEEVRDVVISNGVTSIGDMAFSGCSSLTSVTIGNSVTSIGGRAFSGCIGLTSITIPYGVTSIGERAFSGCDGLTSVTIPNSVTSIGYFVFSNCSGLTSVTIGNSVPAISYCAFYLCSSLTSVTIPNGVTSIGNEAFYGCSSLTSVTIPNSVTSIGERSFNGCSGLKNVYIGEGIKNIFREAFAYCDKLQDFYCYAYHYPKTKEDVFKESYIDYVTLHVPMDAVEQYKAAEPWKNFKSIVGLEGSMVETPKCATPVIVYENGKLYLSCETSGVEYVTDFVSNDNKNNSVIGLNGTYTVRVYAKKFGYDNSDVATKVINLSEGGTSSGKIGDVNGDGVVNAADVVKVTNVIMGAE